MDRLSDNAAAPQGDPARLRLARRIRVAWVEWALAEYAAGGLVTIIPIVRPGAGWEKFPELHRFQGWKYLTPASRPQIFDRLAKGNRSDFAQEG